MRTATLLYARQKGIASAGVELTPLGNLIANVRLDPPSDLHAALEFAEGLVRERNEFKNHSFPKELVDWIGQENTVTLSNYLMKLTELSDHRLRRWLQLAVSSALRPCSAWLAGSIKPQVDPSRRTSPIEYHFLRAARILYKA